MNINYHLSIAEARDGLNGLLPKWNKGALRIAGLFAVFTVGLIVYMAINGFQWRYFFFAVAGAIAAVWFFINRMISVNLIGGRSAGDYMITISPDGWVRSGKEGKKIKFTKDAYGAETPLTVSFKPDADHMYVVSKNQMTKERIDELMDLLDRLNCKISRLSQ